jgi:arylsulfatase A-like enzyme
MNQAYFMRSTSVLLCWSLLFIIGIVSRPSYLCATDALIPTKDGSDHQSEMRQPNIVFIFCDDLGWGDFGVLHQNHSEHSKRHRTPNIDRMASEGVVMQAHYCGAPVCAPSRATLLSGVHQGHAEVRDNQFDKALANNHTIASILGAAGYKTWMVGKHGLQGEGMSPEDWSAYPTKRGFDRFYGYVRHADGHVHYPADRWPLGNTVSHQSPKEVWSGNREVSKGLSKCYTTDLFTARGKQWMIDQVRSDGDQPFFLYLAYDTPHAALQLPTVAYPTGSGVNGGLQWIGQPGHMINTAEGEIDSYRHPDYLNKGWKDVEVRFATMVRRIDDCVGDILQTVRDLGIDQETIVVISSDNGPLNVSYLSGQPIEADSFQSYGPFEGIKRDVWEGGIRMATVAWGPGYLSQNLVDHHPSQSQDWMATFADFAGVLAPARCDGVSLRSALTGHADDQLPSRVYVEYQNGGKTPRYDDFEVRKQGLKRGQMQVVHVDGFKGVRLNIKTGLEPFEIYDLRTDLRERINLAGQSDAYDELQQAMQRVVTRGRRPSESAPRPYDRIPVASLTATERKSSKDQVGVQWRWVDGDFSYTPDLRNVVEDRRGVGSSPNQSERPFEETTGAIEMISWLQVSETGEYQFRVDGLRRGFIRLHEAALFDLDFPLAGTQTHHASIRLEKGLHPIRLTMRMQDWAGEIKFSWKLPGENQFKSMPKDVWLIPGNSH